MRRRNCVRNLDTPISVRQETPSDDDKVRILERRAAAYCGHMVRHCTRASRELVDEICHPRFEREIKLVRM